MSADALRRRLPIIPSAIARIIARCAGQTRQAGRRRVSRLSWRRGSVPPAFRPKTRAFSGVKISGPAPQALFHLSPQVGSSPTTKPSALAFWIIASTWAKYGSFQRVGSWSINGRRPARPWLFKLMLGQNDGLNHRELLLGAGLKIRSSASSKDKR